MHGFPSSVAVTKAKRAQPIERNIAFLFHVKIRKGICSNYIVCFGTVLSLKFNQYNLGLMRLAMTYYQTDNILGKS
jgi:hypothetical protein